LKKASRTTSKRFVDDRYQVNRFDPVRHGAIPLFLLIWSPLMVMTLACIHFRHHSSVMDFIMNSTPTAFISRHIWGSCVSMVMVLLFATFQLALMKLLPGKRVKGPVSPNNYVPEYTENGVSAFLVTMCSYVLATTVFGLFPASIIYDNFADILGTLNWVSIVLCAFLYLKGIYAPSSKDSGSSGFFTFDYFWGTELHPSVCGWSVKMFTNCRFGMMSWGLVLISYAAAQRNNYGYVSTSMFVSTFLQLVYIFKFFWWETGYLRSLDIMHDRAGFYICWGCLVWVPSVYTSPTLYLVSHPNELGLCATVGITLAGLLCIYVNYAADDDRRRVRESNGNTLVWGKPAEVIVANYITECGQSKQSLLLVSGWWSISRHFHYIPELGAAFCWSVPALFENVSPYFYFIFLLILLTDRSVRDDYRCAHKYGSDWDLYCERVRWNIIPYVF